MPDTRSLQHETVLTGERSRPAREGHDGLPEADEVHEAPIKTHAGPADAQGRPEGITEDPMRRNARKRALALVLAAAFAAALPAGAESTAAAAPAPADGGSCRPQAAGSSSPASRQADLAAISARLAAEAQRAGAGGPQPLNTRGYNYDAGRPDAAALGFEAHAR